MRISIGPAHCYAEWWGHTLVLKAGWSLSVHTTVAAWNVCMQLRRRLSLHEGHIYWQLLSYAQHKYGGKNMEMLLRMIDHSLHVSCHQKRVSGFSRFWPVTHDYGHRRVPRRKELQWKWENLLLCECFIAQQEIRKVFMICHKTVDILANYNKHTGNGTKWKSRFAEYGCKPEWEQLHWHRWPAK